TVPGHELRRVTLEAIEEAANELRLGVALLADGPHAKRCALAKRAADRDNPLQVDRREIAAGGSAALVPEPRQHLGIGHACRDVVDAPDAIHVGDGLDVEDEDRCHAMRWPTRRGRRVLSPQAGNTPVDRYRSPRSQTTNTIVASRTSGEMPRDRAHAPPDEMPQKMPSSRASRRAMSSAAACETFRTR